MKSLIAVPITWRQAAAFVDRHHRHHDEPRGHKFSIGATTPDQLEALHNCVLGEVIDHLCGVVIVGRPVARERQDGFTAEITRLCTDGLDRKVTDRRGREHTLAICSFLYRAADRAARAMGYLRVGTYTLASEPGTSLEAAGFRKVAAIKGRSWDTPSRRRQDHHPTDDKTLWETG